MNAVVVAVLDRFADVLDAVIVAVCVGFALIGNVVAIAVRARPGSDVADIRRPVGLAIRARFALVRDIVRVAVVTPPAARDVASSPGQAAIDVACVVDAVRVAIRSADSREVATVRNGVMVTVRVNDPPGRVAGWPIASAVGDSNPVDRVAYRFSGGGHESR